MAKKMAGEGRDSAVDVDPEEQYPLKNRQKAGNDEEDGGTVGAKSEGPMDIKKILTRNVIIGIIVAVVAAVSIAVMVVYVPGGSGGGGATVDCDHDDFRPVSVVRKDKDDKEVTTYLKYNFTKKSELEAFSFAEAKKACADKGAELWEVSDQYEWEAIMGAEDSARSRKAVWLNAEVKESCPSGVDVCRGAEAPRGKGLRVRWPVAAKESEYSRLVGGVDSPCVYVEKTGPGTLNVNRVWRKDECGSSYSAACVKRNCKPPPPTAA